MAGKFVKGHPKYGGRKKGTKNKKTIFMERMGIDRIDDLAPDVLKVFYWYINKGKGNEPLIAAKEVAKYVFPAKKEVEHSFKDVASLLSEEE